VFEREPQVHPALLELDNVVLVRHRRDPHRHGHGRGRQPAGRPGRPPPPQPAQPGRLGPPRGARLAGLGRCRWAPTW
jgi:hypothetical protein